jgi:hypothetical protein
MCKDYLEMGLSRKDVHIKYGVSKCNIKYSNLYSWVSKYQDKIVNTADYSEEDKYKILYELSLQENKMLKAELEILKKNEEILEFLEKEE